MKNEIQFDVEEMAAKGANDQDDTNRPTRTLKNFIRYRSISKYFESTYSGKKAVAQRMMDVSLLTANANQLQYLFKLHDRDKDTVGFWIPFVLILSSIILQVTVGVLLIFKKSNGTSNQSNFKNNTNVIRFNSYVVLVVFFITIINIFIGAFCATLNKNI